MSVSPLLVLALAGGAAFGGGIAVLLAGLLPAAPALGPALDRLYPATRPPRSRSLVAWLSGRLQVPRADLAVLGQTSESYVVRLIGSALFGLGLPTLISVLALIIGLPVAPYLPVGAAVIAAAVGVWFAHRGVVERARAARGEFARALCTYLDLAATQVRGGHGPMESLDRAAGICHGWAFDHIRAALARAELQLTPPWDELKRLSIELDVVELGDLADIMRSAGTEGAQAYQTLRAKADSLRGHIRTRELEKAEVRTNKLDIPAAALIFVLLALMSYPFLAGMIFQ
ncbi:MAG TPA: type II secretion system F family protein [Micromonosporaceae bacterium]|nr:type II secretion system F family protein [Micromonosporaceae bacterium]